MSKCILDVWEGRIPTCMAGYLVCDEEKCPNFIQEVKIEKAIETLKARKKFIADINFDAHYAYDLAISALEKQLSGGWIPVSERLPEKSGKYLITIKNLTGFEMPKEYIFICDYFHAIKEFMFDSWEDNKIVAWQPLPEPFKGVE